MVTEIFPEDDPYLDQDTVFGVRYDLVMTDQQKQASEFPEGLALSGAVVDPFLYVNFDVTRARSGLARRGFDGGAGGMV